MANLQCAECAQYVGTNDGPPPHDHEFEIAVAFARDEGERDGKAAASWYFDGNTDAATYARVLQGIEDGDPAVLDTFPTADLSGQNADTRTGPDLYADAIRAGYGDESADARAADPLGSLAAVDGFTDVCDAYEIAYNDAAQDEIERVARYQTSDLGRDERGRFV